ncbi:flavin reductase family protein [Spongiimicrobium salis]|uniref:flavin reductase family protein n=1 Tax=Spongiimicrobium salis TaxID=1667022 RepID=UPI00374D002E
MQYTQTEIQQMDRVKRLKLINSLSGVKPGNLIGSISDKGEANVAVFSSVIHLGSDPALLGFISRPTGEISRHTYENIMENGSYTINHIPKSHIKNAHYTSAKFDRKVSEFEACGLTASYYEGIQAPFVEESKLKIGMQFVEAIPIPRNGTVLMIGEVVFLDIMNKAMTKDHDVDLSAIQGVGISGLNTYYGLEKLERFPYVRLDEIPDFEK